MNIFRRIGGSNEEVDQKGTLNGAALVAQGLPPFALLTASGNGWIAAATSAVASLVAVPTSTAMGTLWNGEVGGGKSYIIDRAFFATFAGDESWTGAGHLMYCLHDEMAAVVDEITIRGLRGGDLNYSGKARFDIAASVTDDTWYQLGSSSPIDQKDKPGSAKETVVAGRIIIPPQCGMSLSVLSNDADATVKVGISWFEIQLDLG